jgi:hypothetical protein
VRGAILLAALVLIGCPGCLTQKVIDYASQPSSDEFAATELRATASVGGGARTTTLEANDVACSLVSYVDGLPSRTTRLVRNAAIYIPDGSGEGGEFLVAAYSSGANDPTQVALIVSRGRHLFAMKEPGGGWARVPAAVDETSRGAPPPRGDGPPWYVVAPLFVLAFIADVVIFVPLVAFYLAPYALYGFASGQA